MPSINSKKLLAIDGGRFHICFCGMFTPGTLGKPRLVETTGEFQTRIIRPQRCGVLHPVRRRLRVNDVVDVVKMFLGFTGPRKGNPEIPIFFREIQVLVNFEK